MSNPIKVALYDLHTLTVEYSNFREHAEIGLCQELLSEQVPLPAPYANQSVKFGFSAVDYSVDFFVEFESEENVLDTLKMQVYNYQCTAYIPYSFEKLSATRYGQCSFISFTTNDEAIDDEGSVQVLVKFPCDVIFDELLTSLLTTNAVFVMPKAIRRAAELYEKQIGLDLDIVVDGETIKASKLILASNSEVFTTMFDGNWKEASESKWVIKKSEATNFDLDFATMNAFIRALHGVEVKLASISMALKLSALCKMYEVKELREQAEAYVRNGLSKTNVIEALVYAVDHGIDDVKKQAIDFVTSRNYVDIEELTGIEDMPAEVMFMLMRALRKAQLACR